MATTDSTLANRRDYDEIVANLLRAEVAEAVENPPTR